MTAYIDLASIASTPELSHAKAEMLELSGTLVPPEHRASVLQHATAGDTVYCGTGDINFWRKLHPRVRLIDITDLSKQDPVSRRITSWLVWSLIQLGVPPTKARRMEESPPKTARHGRYVTFQGALVLASAMQQATPNIPDTLETIGSEHELAPREQPYKWTLIDTEEKLQWADDLLNGYQRVVLGVDVETDVAGERPNEMRDVLAGVGVSIGEECFYGTADNKAYIDMLRRRLPAWPWVGHSAKYDMAVLRRHGINPGNVAGDGRLAAYLLGEPEAGLKGLVKRHFNWDMITYNEVVGTGAERVDISEVDPELTAEYCCGDAYWGVEIEKLLASRLNDRTKKLYEEVELPLISVLCDMQMAGIPLDRGLASERLGETTVHQFRLAEIIDTLAHQSGYTRPNETSVCITCHNGKNKKLTCEDCAGLGKFSSPVPLNPGSSQQVADWLHNHLSLPVQALTPQGAPSVDALSLLRMKDSNSAIPLILQWKHLDKYRGYLVKWLALSEADGKLHPVINNARVRSGRLSAEEPNTQQIKLEWRDAFPAEVS